jgi:UMF1 family MFS transporter
MEKNKKQIYSWVLYDWANSAFATTILAAVLPIFYNDVAAASLPDNLATSYWGYTQTIAMLIIAVLAPVLGAIADSSNSRRSFLKYFAILGMIGTGLLFFVSRGQYLLASLFFIIGSIGFSGGNVFYDSFLPIISPKDKVDYTSTLGYSAGYLGGGILLVINLLMITKPSLFGIADTLTATRLTFVTVAVWWFIFAIPAFRNLPESGDIEDNARIQSRARLTSYFQTGFSRLANTFKHARKYRELFKFLLAFWVYNDGIGTIIRMATIYGREVGIGQNDLIAALLLTQVIGIPFALLFGKLAEKIGAKKSIYITLVIYLFITVRGYFLATAVDFWILAGLVGLVQGGAQALSRSLYAGMVPVNKTSEFYGFFGISSKFAAITGPFLFAFVGQITGSSRFGIISVALFFLVGLILLSRVDIEKGKLESLS